MSQSTKRLVLLSLLTAMALTIFIVEAQIPLPVAIPGIKLGLSNVITLIVLAKFRTRDALTVLLLRILLGSIFTGQLSNIPYSLCGGLLCLAGMALLCKLFQRKYLWFISVIGALLHNIGQIIAAIFVMQSVQVVVYLPFLSVAGCVTGLFTGFAAAQVVKHWPISAHISHSVKSAKKKTGSSAASSFTGTSTEKEH